MTRVEFHLLGKGRSLAQHLHSLLGERAGDRDTWLCAPAASLARWRARLGERRGLRLVCPATTAAQAPLDAALIIGLGAEPSPLFSAFERAVDVVDLGCERACKAGRLRYRFYCDRGYPVSTRRFAADEEVNT